MTNKLKLSPERILRWCITYRGAASGSDIEYWDAVIGALREIWKIPEGQERKILTHFVHPPIPPRCFDYCAWYEDDGEEAGNYGWGETKDAAIKDLVQRYGDGL